MQRLRQLPSILALLLLVVGRGFPAHASEEKLEEAIPDIYLMKACRMLIKAVNSKDASDEMPLSIVAASYRLRSNVVRCQEMYGKSWNRIWDGIKPHLSLVYSKGVHILSMGSENELWSQALLRLEGDIHAMDLEEHLTALSVK